MAGTLEISGDLCWMPAGWVYDNVLERMASFLKDKDASLSDMLLQSRTDENGGYIDLRICDANRLTALVQAADGAYAQVESEGASSFYDPTSYPGFLDQFRKLLEMLHDGQQKRMHAE